MIVIPNIVNESTGSRTIECPKLVHKSMYTSLERKCLTPVSLEKKFNDFERNLKRNNEANQNEIEIENKKQKRN